MTDRLHVDRIEVRLRAGSPRSGHELAAELRRALPAAVEGALSRQPAQGAVRLSRVDAPAVRVARGTPARTTAAAVASAVADGLASRPTGVDR